MIVRLAPFLSKTSTRVSCALLVLNARRPRKPPLRPVGAASTRQHPVRGKPRISTNNPPTATAPPLTIFSACLTCPIGHMCPVATIAPIPCPSGYYAAAGATSCTLCTAGQYCPLYSESETACPTGSYSRTAYEQCLTCPAGYSCDASTSADPMICPVTNFKVTEGPGTCSSCPAGQECLDRTTVPTNCVNGEYSLTNNGFCSICA